MFGEARLVICDDGVFPKFLSGIELGFCGGDLLFGVGDLSIHFGQGPLLIESGGGHAFVAFSESVFLNIGKESAERIKVAGGERIKLMVVALGATGGLSHPSGTDGADAIGDHSGFVVFGLGAAFFGGEDEAIERGTDASLGGGIGEKIAGDLFDSEAIEAFVIVERLDHPIAIGPDIVGVIAVVADGIGEADDIEPTDGHAFAVMGAGEEAIDEFFVGIGGGILEESGGFFCGGREADDIKGKSTDEGSAIGFWGGFEADFGEAFSDEKIDAFLGWRNGCFDWGFIGPVFLIFRALGDPAAEHFLLASGQWFVGFGWGHEFIFIAGEDAADDFTFFWVGRNDGDFTGFGGFEGLLADIEAEFGFAGIFVGAVAVEASIGEDGSEVAIELDFGGQGELGGPSGGGEEGEEERKREMTHGGKKEVKRGERGLLCRRHR